MDCVQFNQVLPEIIDEHIRDFRSESRIGEIYDQQSEFEKHLKSCPECSELVADLRTISAQAQTLHGAEEPSSRVWNRIELVLRQEGLIQKASQPEIVFSNPPRRWRMPRFVPIAAAALIALSIVGYQRLSTPQQAGERATAAPVAAKTEVAVAKAKAVRSKDVVAKDALKNDQEFLALVSSRRPAMRAKYEKDLQRVNAYIQDAENSVQTDPNDQEAQQYLMNAYQQKAVMYQLALDRSLP